jgi:hypothetical protein
MHSMNIVWSRTSNMSLFSILLALLFIPNVVVAFQRTRLNPIAMYQKNRMESCPVSVRSDRYSISLHILSLTTQTECSVTRKGMQPLQRYSSSGTLKTECKRRHTFLLAWEQSAEMESDEMYKGLYEEMKDFKPKVDGDFNAWIKLIKVAKLVYVNPNDEWADDDTLIQIKQLSQTDITVSAYENASENEDENTDEHYNMKWLDVIKLPMAVPTKDGFKTD